MADQQVAPSTLLFFLTEICPVGIFRLGMHWMNSGHEVLDVRDDEAGGSGGM